MRKIIAEAAAVILWPTQQAVPLAGTFNVFRSVADGADVSYAAAVNALPIPAWPISGGGKVGWGLGEYGQGPYGLPSGGFGWGEGPYGLGPYGVGAQWIEFTTAALPDATYKFAAVGYDPAGNRTTPATAIATVALAGIPDPPGIPTATNYDAGADALTLQWTLSPDDEESA